MSADDPRADGRREMDLPTERNPCRNCGRWGHEHDKEKVFTDGGRWHWEYYCPDSASSVATMRERLVERVGSEASQLIEEFRRRRPRGADEQQAGDNS